MLVSLFRRRLTMALGPSVKVTTLKGRGRIQWQGAFSAVLPRIVVYGEGKQDGTPTPDKPIEPVFLEGASVGARGKNLIPFPYVDDSNTIYGVTYVIEDDGTVIVNGTSTKNVNIHLNNSFLGKIRNGEMVTFSANANNTPGPDTFWIYYHDKVGGHAVFAGRITFVADDIDSMFVRIVSGYTANNLILRPQLEYGSTPTPYEPYFDGGTARLPILRALPDGSVRDEYEVISGAKTNKIREVVFNEKLINSLRWLDGYAYKDGFLPSVNLSLGLFTHGEYGPLSSTILEGRICIFPSGIMRVSVGKSTLAETQEFMRVELKKGQPLKAWYALAEPIIEHYDPAILRQHPGYTQLIQEGGFREAEIEADVYQREEVTP